MDDSANAAKAERAPTASPLTDVQLVARVLDGDTELFEILMRRHNQALYRAVRAVLRSESDVEDVMQQAYLAAFTHLDQFAGQAKFSTWLLTIAINEARARLRRGRRLVPIADDADDKELAFMDPRPAPEARLASRELAALLERCIDQLPDGHREVLVLRLVEGLDTEATARILAISEDATKQRLHRARGLVQRRLETEIGGQAGHLFELHADRCDRVVAGVLARLPVPGGPAR